MKEMHLALDLRLRLTILKAGILALSTKTCYMDYVRIMMLFMFANIGVYDNKTGQRIESECHNGEFHGKASKFYFK